MDFDRFLTRVQTCLKSIEKRVGIKLNDITRDNNEEIDTVCQLFSTFLKELDPGKENLRHINLYLLINSDFICLSQIDNDTNFCHLFNTLPKISSLMYFELINRTDLFKFVGELILFCPEVLSIDILKCVSVNLRLIEPDIAVEFLSLIYESLYVKILTLHGLSDNENIKQYFVKIFSRIFEFSIFEIFEKTSYTLEKKKCCFGYYVKSLLNIIEKCIGFFNSGCPIEPNNLYQLKIEFDYKSWDLLIKEENWPVYCLQVMIGKAQKAFNFVTMDIYIAWFEEQSEGRKAGSLQSDVREAAYSCRESLYTLSKYEEEIVDLPLLIKVLDDIALKPKSEDDEIKEADVETLVHNMKDPNKTQLKWIRAYLNIENILLESRCVENLKDAIKIFDKSTTVNLIKKFTKHLMDNKLPEKSIEDFKQIIINCVRSLKIEEQLDILNTVALEGSDSLKTTNFNQNVTETFNKLVSQNEQMEKVIQDIIILSLESGRELVTLIIADCLKATSLCDIFIQIMLEMPLLTKYSTSQTDSSPLCLYCVVEHFNRALQMGSEDRDSLIYLVKRLSWFSIINGKEFVVNHLIPAIQRCVSEKKWKDIDLCLDLLEPFVDGSGGDHVKVCEAEVIAFLAQLLNGSRLPPTQFTLHSGNVMQKTSSFLFTLTNSFIQNKNEKTEKEASWLREMGKNLSPMTCFPMRKLWTGLEFPHDRSNQLIWSKQYLSRKDLLTMDDKDRGPFVIQLCKLLPLLTLSEWKMIGFELGGAERAPHCIAIHHILADCLLVLNQLPVISANPTCMAHLISGFTSFFKVKTVKALKHSERDVCLTVLNKQVILVNELSNDLVGSRLAAVSSVLQDSAASVLDKAAKNQMQSDLLSIVASLKDTQLQSMLSNTLLKKLSA